jgi:ClpP class serine protease
MWLISDEWRERLARAFGSGWHVTNDIAASVEARRAQSLETNNVINGVARIDVVGPLTKTPDPFLAFFLGANTAYSDINAQVNAAVASPEVNAIELFVDSPGGTVDGLFETLDTLRAAREQKPITVRADNALSAAYSIAAVAGSIEATSRGARFGSVGIVTSFLKDDPREAITSTDAPNKAPDPNTEEGRAVIVQELDAIHELFVSAIGEGRSKSPDAVNSDFGRGGSFVAGDALNRGMIDSIAQPELRVVSNQTAAAAAQTGAKNVTLEELKAQFPAAYAAAVDEGVKQERSRVCAHIRMGEQSGGHAIAFEAIREGKDFGAEVQADYLAAHMAKNDKSAHQSDSDDATNALQNATGVQEDHDALGEKVASIVEGQLGISAEA